MSINKTDEENMNPKITIYTKGFCPFCIAIKNFLVAKQLDFEDIEVSSQPELHREIIQKTGHRTVPAVFVDDTFIGGSEDFYEWYAQNMSN